MRICLGPSWRATCELVVADQLFGSQILAYVYTPHHILASRCQLRAPVQGMHPAADKTGPKSQSCSFARRLSCCTYPRRSCSAARTELAQDCSSASFSVSARISKQHHVTQITVDWLLKPGARLVGSSVFARLCAVQIASILHGVRVTVRARPFAPECGHAVLPSCVDLMKAPAEGPTNACAQPAQAHMRRGLASRECEAAPRRPPNAARMRAW